MNLLRQLLAIFAGKPKPAAAASPAPAAPQMHSPRAAVIGCSCALCTGKMDIREVARLTSDLAMQIDASIIAISVGKIRAATKSCMGVGPGGVAGFHVVVCNDDVFSKLQNALRDEPQ